MPDRVFCRRHDPDGHANWDSGFRPLLDDTCYMCAAEQLEQQLKQAHREGWEQAKREAQQALCEICCYNSADNPVPDECTTCNESRAIASMEYKGTGND